MKKKAKKRRNKKGFANNSKDIAPSVKNISKKFKEFNIQDILQITVGSFVLAVPVGFTQEVWEMAERLPLVNMIALTALTLFFIGIFTFYSYHREHMNANPKYHLLELGKRVISTYLISFIIVAILMTIIGVTPWKTNLSMAINIVVLVTFPAAIGAVISDRIK